MEPAQGLSLIKSLIGMLRRLRRAERERLVRCRKLLVSVVDTARRTSVYVREVNGTGVVDYAREMEISSIWTNLAFDLKAEKFYVLAKRCDIKGRYWADPQSITDDFAAEAGIGLRDVELLAIKMISEIDS